MKYQVGDMLKYKSQTEMGYCVVKDLYSHYESGDTRVKVIWLAYSYDGHNNLKQIELTSDYNASIMNKAVWSKPNEIPSR